MKGSDAALSAATSQGSNVRVRLNTAYDVLISRPLEKEHEKKVFDRIRQVTTGLGIPKSDVRVNVRQGTKIVEYILTFKPSKYGDSVSPAGVYYHRADPRMWNPQGRPIYSRTSSFYVDRGPVVKGGPVKYHWNIKGGFTKTGAKVADHAVTRGAKATGRGIKAFRVLGKVTLVLTIVMDAAELALAVADDIANNRVSRTPRTLARMGGRWGGAVLGAKALGTVGAAFGAWAAPGPGIMIGGGIGLILGGIIGAVLGEEAVNWVIDAIEGALHRVAEMLQAILEKGRRIRDTTRAANTPAELFDAAMSRHRALQEAFSVR